MAQPPRLRCGFLPPFLYGRILSMRGGSFIVGLAFCLTTGPAAAQGWMPERPPPEYQVPYEGVLTMIGVPLREISSHCRNMKNVWACAYHNAAKDSCTIYVPINVPQALRDALYEHEIGHCNGWWHPQPEAPLPLAKPN